MRRIREVLRLRAELGANLSAIAAGAKLARSTVRTYLDRAAAAGLETAGAGGWLGAALAGAVVSSAPPAPRRRGPSAAGLGRGGSGTAAPQARHAQAAVDGVQGHPSRRLRLQPVQTAAERMAESLRAGAVAAPGASCRRDGAGRLRRRYRRGDGRRDRAYGADIRRLPAVFRADLRGSELDTGDGRLACHACPDVRLPRRRTGQSGTR